MSKLEDAGYVQVEKSFVDRKPKTMFSITKVGLNAFMNYRKSLREMLESGGEES